MQGGSSFERIAAIIVGQTTAGDKENTPLGSGMPTPEREAVFSRPFFTLEPMLNYRTEERKAHYSFNAGRWKKPHPVAPLVLARPVRRS